MIEKILSRLVPFILKLFQKESVWFFIMTTLFTGAYIKAPEMFHIIAGLLALWVFIFAFLGSRK